MPSNKSNKISQDDIDAVVGHVLHHAECNSFAFGEEMIILDLRDIAVETGVERDIVCEILATTPIEDSFLVEEFGRSMYSGPFYRDASHGDYVVYCTPGSMSEREYKAYGAVASKAAPKKRARAS